MAASPSPCADGIEDPAGETTGGIAGDIAGDIAGSIETAEAVAGACADACDECERRDVLSASDAGDKDPTGGDIDNDRDNANVVGNVGGIGGGVRGTTISTPLPPTLAASPGSSPDGPDADGDRGKACAAAWGRESGHDFCNAEVGDIVGLVTGASGDRDLPWLVTPTPSSPASLSVHPSSSGRCSAPLPTASGGGVDGPESSLPVYSDCEVTARSPDVGNLAGEIISSALLFSSSSFSVSYTHLTLPTICSV